MDKKLYFLKEELYYYLEKQEQFLQKNTRPYLKIVELENKYYAIPLRSELNKHNVNLQLPILCTHGKKGYLDFSKSFQVVTPDFFYTKEEYSEIVSLDHNKVIELLKYTNNLKKQNKLKYAINDYKFMNLQRNIFLKPYLESLGLPTNGRDKFSCLNKNHMDQSPSMSYNPKNNKVHCFSCGETYNFINLIRHTYDLNYKQATEYIDKIIKNNFSNFDFNNIAVPQTNNYNEVSKKQLDYIHEKIESCAKNIRQTDYLLKRGISYETCEKLKVGYDVKNNQIILPMRYFDYFIKRNIDSNSKLRYVYMKDRSIPTSMVHTLDKSIVDRPIFITEGYIDMLSMLEVGEVSMSLNGANNLENFKKVLAAYINNEFVIALDNDEAGINATKRIETLLNENGCVYRVLKLDEYKDINECLVKDKNLLLSKIKEVKESFKKNHSLNEKRGIMMEELKLDKTKNDVVIMSDKTKDLIASGSVKQWQKQPTFYFVQGLRKVALEIDENGEFKVSNKFPTKNQKEINFVNNLLSNINEIKEISDHEQINEDRTLVEENENTNFEPIKIEFITDGTLELIKASGVSYQLEKLPLSSNNVNDQMYHITFSSDNYNKYIKFLENPNNNTQLPLGKTTFKSLENQPQEIIREKMKISSKMSMKEKNDELANHMKIQVEKIFSEPLEYKKGLDMILDLPNYSMNNMILVLSQMEQNPVQAGNSPYVKSYKNWQKMGYHVKPKSEAIYIKQPIHIKAFIDEDGNEKLVSDANNEEKLKISNNEIETFVKETIFSPTPVFHYTDTNIDVSFLHEDNISSKYDNIEELYNSLRVNLQEQGIITYERNLGEKRGMLTMNDKGVKSIYINNNLNEAQKIKTLLHEISHHELDHLENRDLLSKVDCELEAESMAYLLCKEYGIDSEDYSFKYLASYSENKDIKHLSNALENVKSKFNLLNDKYFKNIKKDVSLNVKQQNQTNEVKHDMGKLQDIKKGVGLEM